MMKSAFNAEKGSAEYTYDGFRNRVKRLEQFGSPGALMEGELQKTDLCNEIRYILDITRPYNNLIMTEGGSTQRYIWGNELLEAEGADPFYYLHDHLGSPIRLMSSKDDPGKDTILAYDEFGVPLVEAGSANNPFGFTGYQTDNVSGLYYAQARYYNPAVGRFVSEDFHWNTSNMIYGDSLLLINGHSPLPNMLAIKQNANAYDYCINSPLIYEDENGEFAWFIPLIGGAIGALVGGAIQVGCNLYQGNDWNEGLGTAMLAGAVSGAIATIPIPGLGVVAGKIVGEAAGKVVAGAISATVMGGVGNVAGDAIRGDINSFDDAKSSFAVGAVAGAVGFGVGDFGVNRVADQYWANLSRTAQKQAIRDFGIKISANEVRRQMNDGIVENVFRQLAVKYGIDVAVAAAVSGFGVFAASEAINKDFNTGSLKIDFSSGMNMCCE
jgi:RHS repeat-associated protein